MPNVTQRPAVFAVAMLVGKLFNAVSKAAWAASMVVVVKGGAGAQQDEELDDEFKSSSSSWRICCSERSEALLQVMVS